MAKGWGETFADSFTQSFDTAQKMAFEKWKEEQSTSPSKTLASIMPMLTIYGGMKDTQGNPLVSPDAITGLIEASKYPTWTKYLESKSQVPPNTQPIPQGTGIQPQIPTDAQPNLGQGFVGQNMGLLGTRFLPKSPYFTASQDPIAQQYGKTKATEIAKGEMAWGQTDKMIDNMISATKAAYKQAGGGGLVEGTIGNVATALKLPNTGNIQGLKTTARDTAAAYAKVLTGGSRGVLGMFNRILETIPSDATQNPEQAGSSLAEMYLTGAAIEKGLKSGALNPEQLKKMSQSEVEAWVSSNTLSAEEQTQLYKSLSTKFQTIAPRKQINLMTGEVKEPEMNSWNKFYDNLKKGFAKKAFSEENIQHTMKVNKLTREEVMKRLGG